MKSKKIIVFLVMGICLHFQLVAQTVSGKVTSSDDGYPIPGVSVIIKSTRIGTITDIEGNYQIKTNSPNDTLVFSFIGLSTTTICINGLTKIDVCLSSDGTVLEETVVLGYGFNAYRAPRPDYSNESYSKIDENTFKKVSQNPLSTFSVDVDRASYSNIRRMINDGYLPNIDAVRIEEMINYHSYDYPEPDKNKPLSIFSELSYCPWNKQHLLLHIGLKGESISMEKLPPSNIVFLLDVSGSMSSYNKLPLLKSSLKLLLSSLRPIDKVAIVVYAGSAGLVLPTTSCDRKDLILDAIEKLEAGGSTAGGEGLRLAYKIAEENFLKEGNNRIILATDGDFNVGENSNSAMERLIEEKREKGVSISVLGFGMGNYKDDKMEIIANKGNGNYSYIDNLLEAKKVLVNEFGGTFHTIAKDVKFQLEFNPVFISEYRLIGYENRLLDEEDFENDKKDAGDIGSGHTVTALYEIILSNNLKPNHLKYQKSKPTKKAIENNELITLKLRYKQPDSNKSILIEEVIKNTPIELKETSNNFRFAASVAKFGMLLRKSEFIGETTWKSAAELAKGSKGKDEGGYKSEMIRLIESAELLEMNK